MLLKMTCTQTMDVRTLFCDYWRLEGCSDWTGEVHLPLWSQLREDCKVRAVLYPASSGSPLSASRTEMPLTKPRQNPNSSQFLNTLCMVQQ